MAPYSAPASSAGERATGPFGQPNTYRATPIPRFAWAGLTALSLILGCGGGPSVSGADGSGNGGAGPDKTATGGTANTDDIDVGGLNDGTGGTDSADDPCAGPMPPADCMLDYQPTGPGCGDGEVNADGEECDDGNGLPGDGCSGLCKVEPNFVCDAAGCTSTLVCGDGVTQAGEVCDDGDLIDGNGCDSDCLLINDGYFCPPVGGPCSVVDPCKTSTPPAKCFPSTEVLPYCGDGIVNISKAGQETCDDGNPFPGDGCSGACQVEPNWDCSSGSCVFTIVCGNGEVEAGEVCDDGDQDDSTGCKNDCLSVNAGYDCPSSGGTCSTIDPCDLPRPPAECYQTGGNTDPVPYCGDASINQSSEDCDDGNNKPGDGCSGACKVEPNWDCSTGTCVSTIVCGDGVRQGSELCDDGNMTGGDGCSDMCQTIDPNYTCPPAGGSCTSTVVCNDGRLTGGETCEDGNKTNGDGCDSTCHIETGYHCPTIGSPCLVKPYCGDGKQTAGEQCDDGNSSAPGCSATCQIEDGYACPTPGADCVAINVECGNGTIETGENCDDGNKQAGDGCNASCTIEDGYTCPAAGKDCIATCGDGKLKGNEVCDDGGTTSGDGCSANCTFEPGFYCTDTAPTDCAVDICGNGEVGNDEACDDGNNDPGDGCAPDCTAEPDCSAYSTAGCTSECGDGIIIDEECDDGNTKSGDGCSSTCTVEEGFTCEQPAGCDEFLGWDHDDDDDPDDLVSTCVLRIPVVYRDFNKSHPHFEPADNSTGTPGLVMATLDAQGKPDWSGLTDGVITSANSAKFDNWYRDSADSQTYVGELILWDRDRDPTDASYNPDAADVTFVNRYGNEGERYESSGIYTYCGNTGECPADPDTDKVNCSCSTNWNGTGITVNTRAGCDVSDPDIEGCYLENGGSQWYALGPGSSYDGNPAFFPIDGLSGGSPGGDYAGADIPGVYGGGSIGGSHNFHFTSEVRRWFKYDSSRSYNLDFTGDDDVWVFINGKLAVDLGGWHEALNGSFSIAAGGAITASQQYWDGGAWATDTQSLDISDFNMVNGNVYEIVVFQAERKYTASSYRLTLGGFNTNPSTCYSTCGDGKVASDEECDDGVNDGGYGECQPGCVLGSYCGDGTKDSGEECDNGVNLSSWNDTTATACAPGCVKPDYCGDGEVQTAHESCDDGTDNAAGAYSGCTNLCTFGPYCGDGHPDTADGEECDDGVNDGTAGCGPDCKSTTTCGNGQLDGGELCDDGANDGGYGECAPGCVDGPYCGDGYPDTIYGEACDDGSNTGAYGGCTSICQLAPYCGDGIVDASEACDDGINDGGYGECGAGCKNGPVCGDGKVDVGFEECDDGVNDGTVSACQEGCMWGPYCGDGLIDQNEQCDDGSNLGGYNKCAPGCVPGPFCGDMVTQASAGEQCDDGANDGGYGECAANCRLGPYCGDGIINGDETCDDAVNSGAYGRCKPDCTTGSYCGDGIQQPEEECDDGVNDGVKSQCQPGCILGPGCGDHVLQEGEECDLGSANSTAYDGCLPNVCKWGPNCGDGIVQSAYEQCDDGNNPGGYGQCAQNCRLGPYCGDGVVNGNEVCDDGVNDGGYGECAPACKLGPYCGDGKVNGTETCDDGNRKNGDGCSSICTKEVIAR